MENKKNNLNENNKNNKINENNDKQKKFIPLWYRFWLSITGVDKYYFLAVEGAQRSIQYICALTLVICIILTSSFVFETKHLIDDSVKFLKNNISDFTVSSNGLQIENNVKPIMEKIALNSLEITLKRVNQPKIIIDDESSEEKNDETLYKYDGNIIIFGKEKLLFKINSINRNISYKDALNILGMDKINKSDILGFYDETGNLHRLYSTMGITLFVYFFIECLIIMIANIIALSLVGIIVSRTLRMKFKFNGLFSMSTAAITLPSLLTLIYALFYIFTGFTMENFVIMTTLISYVYIVAALINIYKNLVRISGN